MKLDSLKDLKQLFKLCQEMGIEKFEIGGLKLELGPMPTKKQYTKKADKGHFSQSQFSPYIPTEDTRIQTDDLTEEQLLMWSVTSENQ